MWKALPPDPMRTEAAVPVLVAAPSIGRDHAIPRASDHGTTAPVRIPASSPAHDQGATTSTPTPSPALVPNAAGPTCQKARSNESSTSIGVHDEPVLTRTLEADPDIPLAPSTRCPR